jgi:hypothetical protein
MAFPTSVVLVAPVSPAISFLGASCRINLEGQRPTPPTAVQQRHIQTPAGDAQERFGVSRGKPPAARSAGPSTQGLVLTNGNLTDVQHSYTISSPCSQK